MEGIAPSDDAQYDGVPLDPTPSSRQGYGRIAMASSLPLANNPFATGNSGGLNLQVTSSANQPCHCWGRRGCLQIAVGWAPQWGWYRSCSPGSSPWTNPCIMQADIKS